MFRPLKRYVLLAVFFILSQAQDLQFGMNEFPTGEKYFSCGNITFKTPFSSSDVYVHTSLYNKDPTGNTYEAAVNWVENVQATGFKACAVTSGPYRDMATLIVNWMAFSQVPQGSKAGRHLLSSFVSGTACETVYFPEKFVSFPDVYATIVHTHANEKRNDAATLWLENVKKSSFKICLRELKNFNGEHKSFEVSWLGMAEKPGHGNAKEKKRMKMLNDGLPRKSQKYSFCQNSTFDYKFFEPPVIITSASHTFDPGNPRSINPKTNTMSNWIENLDINGLQICMKDGQKLRGKHTPLDITFMALGDYDPCIEVVCGFYAQCVAFGPSDARCICDFSCPSYEDMLCSSAGVTYNNECLYKKAMCEHKQNIQIAHAGSCRPFILQRGRTQVSLDIADVRCTDVTYESNEWYTLLPIHVLITVNYDGEGPGVVHHAVSSWVERISHSKFTACALKAGRNDEETIASGLTYIDWIAFQGSPKGGVVGEQLIADWWDGTTCKALSFPLEKFESSPFVLLSAEHTRIGLKHDAATLWSEDVTAGNFRVCMRELQNFDGLHRNINVNWMAYEYLPRNFFSERSYIHFDNAELPLEAERHAHCKAVQFGVIYEDVPTVLLSATHNSSRSGALIPLHNSIASWIENIDKHGFRVCIKELNNGGKYDPVDIHWAALPECNRTLLNPVNSSVIPDSAVSASSQLSPSTPARLCRIVKEAKIEPFSWCANSTNDQWLQIDLGHLHVVSGVATQGSYDQKAWVTEYQLSYSKNASTFIIYKENSLVRNFSGNVDGSTEVRHKFQDPEEMRYLRFLPTSYVVHICLRVEVYGCDTEPIHVKIISEGCDDSASRCGYSSIEVDGIEGSLKHRGHNVVALDQEGTISFQRVFDTYGDPSAGSKLDSFIKGLPVNTIVLIAVHDSANKFASAAESTLKSIYASDPAIPSFRDSWALIGFKGTPKPSWIQQAYHARGLGPTTISASIPLYGS